MQIKKMYKEICAAAAKDFCDKHLTPTSDAGDISIKDPDTGLIYIWPRPSKLVRLPSWRVLKPENICVVDAEGKLAEDNGLLPTVEMPMHLAIYKARPEINAIIHGHPLYSAAFAITGENIPAALAEQAINLGGEIICAEYGPVASKQLADNIVDALGKSKMAALLRNHGSVVIGTDLENAFMLSDYLEHGAQVAILGKIVGRIQPIDMDNIKDPSLLKK